VDGARCDGHRRPAPRVVSDAGRLAGCGVTAEHSAIRGGRRERAGANDGAVGNNHPTLRCPMRRRSIGGNARGPRQRAGLGGTGVPTFQLHPSPALLRPLAARQHDEVWRNTAKRAPGRSAGGASKRAEQRQAEAARRAERGYGVSATTKGRRLDAAPFGPVCAGA
jgi:hypothetical protein